MRWLMSLWLLLILAGFAEAKTVKIDNRPYWRKPAYKEVIKSLEKANFDSAYIDSVFGAAESLPWYPDLFRRTKKHVKIIPLDDNRSPLFYSSSIDSGKLFLQQHDSLLTAVENEYGVNKEILVAIARVETQLGVHLGEYYTINVFNTVITSSRASGGRKRRAKEELIAFLIICRDNKLNPLAIKGSYAGAIGLVQFMPVSYQRLAVDGNGDGTINLFEWDDAIFSAAHYFQHVGWRRSPNLSANRRAIFRYNRSNSYVRAVIKYAKKISARGANPPHGGKS